MKKKTCVRDILWIFTSLDVCTTCYTTVLTKNQNGGWGDFRVSSYGNNKSVLQILWKVRPSMIFRISHYC